MRMKLYILVGVAGSGKSTFADNYINTTDEKGKIFSSDDYRVKMFGSSKEGNKKGNSSTVFNKMNKDLMREIRKSKKDILVYDATNLTRKRRRALYNNAKNWSKGEVEVRIVYFSLPLIELFENNELRLRFEPEKYVPEDVILRMYKTLQVPRIGVDCDNFEVVGKPMFDYDTLHLGLRNGLGFTKALHESSIKSMGGELDRLFESHDCEPYHLEDIDTHINMCVDSAWARDVDRGDWAKIIRISQFHDLGKSITKQMIEKDGVDRATYREHANVSANYYLNYLNFMRRDFSLESQMDITETIHQHMNAHNGLGEKNIRNNKLDENVIYLCEEFAKIDNKSRIRGVV